ncbi:hypothetical protein N7474_003542 [Penicillium riverlandense]|uniref:uncharacterized protein n=1 Tax=Penicillium riverlandense TaxID=1903569 RepID=UPI002547ADCB|nr:uncharacterized protein N7474_003542 [Penicillium riverlandense]KAJ5826404.1 hypothetical protein N7474_003542 [Penicillium riverlandense]
MNDIPTTKNVKTRKARSKTFTGCWTCRARRVKCDDVHPHCLRCLRSGWQCQGYGLRLGWSPAPGSRSHRRQLSLDPPPAYSMSAAAVTALLAELDGCSADGGAQQRGPFSVFSASSADPKDTECIRYSNSTLVLSSSHEHREGKDQRIPEPGAGDSTTGTGDSDQSSSLALTSEESYTTESSSIAEDDRRILPNPPEPVTTVDEDSRIATLSFTINQKSHFENLYPDLDKQLALIKHYEGSSLGLSPSTALNPFPLPRAETELVHHWVVFLSGNMLLIDTPDNPCRTVFMPMALKGLGAPTTESNIHLSIFHAICASSAFSLFHIRKDTRYQSLAVNHDQQALRHLRCNLQRARRINEPTLAAILSCITAEAMSGRRSRWRAHVAGGLGLLENEVHDEWLRSTTASRLLKSYLSLSSLCSLPMSSQLASLLNEPSESRHYLERSHGVTTQLVQFLAHVNALIDSHTAIHADMLDRLELELYLNFPCMSTSTTRESIIIQHALNAFYYATIVYFRRTLRRVPLCDVQELVEKAIQELEAADALTNDGGGCAYNWACFVAAAECERRELQTRMLAYFDRKSRHGIQNINVLCEIVLALWHRRAKAPPETDILWQEIAKEADFDIMLV